MRSFEGRLAAPPVRMTHTPTAHASNLASGAGSGGAGSGGAGSGAGAGAGARPAVPAAVAPAPASAPAPAPAAAPAAAPLASPGVASGGGSPAPMIRLRCNQCGGQMDCRLDTHVNLVGLGQAPVRVCTLCSRAHRRRVVGSCCGWYRSALPAILRWYTCRATHVGAR